MERIENKTIEELESAKKEALAKEEFLVANEINEELKKRKLAANGKKDITTMTMPELDKMKADAVAKEDFVIALAVQEEIKKRKAAEELKSKTPTTPGAKPVEENFVEDDLIINDDMKKAITKRQDSMLPQPALTGNLAADAFILSSYGMYRQFYKLESILQFLRIEQKEIDDPLLGRVTVVKCYDNLGNEIPCDKINKEERTRIYNKSLVASGKILANTGIMLVSGGKVLYDFKSSPISGAFAIPSLTKSIRILNKVSASAKNTKANLEASLKCVELLKE